VRGDFEFDKIVLAIALGIFIFIFSDNFANILYRPILEPDKRGFSIELTNADSGSNDAITKALPENVDIRSVMAAADPKTGEGVFKKNCAVCHNASKGEPNKIGPNLWGVIGSVAGQRPGFSYSTSMSGKGEGGLKWDYKSLYDYLRAPKLFVPGTKMAFAGVKNDQARASLVSYIRTLSDSIPPLP
jgi:cytochrome c